MCVFVYGFESILHIQDNSEVVEKKCVPGVRLCLGAQTHMYSSMCRYVCIRATALGYGGSER